VSHASELATRLCYIANTNFGNKDQECNDLVAASKELLLLNESKGGKWCKNHDHWISVNAVECNMCLIHKKLKNINPINHTCRTCGAVKNTYCIDTRAVKLHMPFHSERWISAIRTV